MTNGTAFERALPYLQTALAIFVLTFLFAVARAPAPAQPAPTEAQRAALAACAKSIPAAAMTYDVLAECVADSGAIYRRQ